MNFLPQSGIVVLVPAYQPGPALRALAEGLSGSGLFDAVVVVDDGSGDGCRPLFDQVAEVPRVHLLRHEANRGKGAALKTGIEFVLREWPSCLGVVTADADGQHALDDIVAVAEAFRRNPRAVTTGARAFSGTVPLRSRAGNALTRAAFRILSGSRVSDTQTGLRALPRRLLPDLLQIQANRYEFELDALLTAISRRVPIFEIPIRTLYFDGNAGSHFHALFDSIRIYYVLLRFSLTSLLSAGVDNLVFVVALNALGSIGGAQVAGRLVAVTVTYFLVRNAVFLSDRAHLRAIPRYLMIVAGSGLVSYFLLTAIHRRLGWAPLLAKLCAEGLLFLVNFVLLRDVVFREDPEVRPGRIASA